MNQPLQGSVYPSVGSLYNAWTTQGGRTTTTTLLASGDGMTGVRASPQLLFPRKSLNGNAQIIERPEDYADHYQDAVSDTRFFPEIMNTERKRNKQSSDNNGTVAQPPTPTPSENNTIFQLEDSKSSFPSTLYFILVNANKYGIEQIISWLPHGRAFQIYDRGLFEKEVMPRFFQSNQFTSFSRQMGHYQFDRIKDGPEKGAYYHDLFLRGRPDLSASIRRPKRRPIGQTHFRKRRPTPDFYKFPVCQELTYSQLIDLWKKRNNAVQQMASVEARHRSTAVSAQANDVTTPVNVNILNTMIPTSPKHAMGSMNSPRHMKIPAHNSTDAQARNMHRGNTFNHFSSPLRASDLEPLPFRSTTDNVSPGGRPASSSASCGNRLTW